MVMMLPFLLAAIAAGTALYGNRRWSLGFWLATLVIYLAWLRYHMTDALPISL